MDGSASGLCSLLLKHTSAAITINHNADCVTTGTSDFTAEACI